MKKCGETFYGRHRTFNTRRLDYFLDARVIGYIFSHCGSKKKRCFNTRKFISKEEIYFIFLFDEIYENTSAFNLLSAGIEYCIGKKYRDR